MAASQNIIGPRLRTIRREKGLTQSMLAARCGILGWDIGENIITKIETDVRCVGDIELMCLALALDITPAMLLPPIEKVKAIVKSYYSEKASRLDD